MNPEIMIIEPQARDGFGQYAVQGGRTLVFPVTIPLLGSLEIITQHTRPESQDFSLDLWLSNAPLDGLLLTEGLGHMRLSRDEETIVIYDQFLRTSDEDDRLLLPSGLTLYINVKNLQNAPNTMILDIQEIPGAQ